MKFWLLMSAVAILDILGISLGKFYVSSQKPWIFAAAVLSYTLMGALLVLALNYKTMAVTNIIWAALTIIVVTSIGYFYFKESITISQCVGIALVMIGMVLVNK